MYGANDVGRGLAVDVIAGTRDAIQDQAGAAAARLLRELCHDLIEPAASIKLLVHAAHAEASPETSVCDCLRLIAKEAGIIADICGQVLGQPRRIDPVRLDVLAAEAVASARLRFSGVIDAAVSPVALEVHPAVILRILGNLLTNACRAAGTGGRVRLVVAVENDQARLSVADTGDGLGQGMAGRNSLGLEIIGKLALGCGGTVQMGVSDLGGLCVTVAFPCPPQPELPARDRGRVYSGSAGLGREDGSLPG